jgi:hypothetical protein
MKEALKTDAGREPREPRGESQKDRRNREAMSPSMRQLILSFGEADSADRTWDPEAYARPKNVA